MAIRVERNGPVTTVILDRPMSRNAVDRDTASELADAFRRISSETGMETHPEAVSSPRVEMAGGGVVWRARFLGWLSAGIASGVGVLMG